MLLNYHIGRLVLSSLCIGDLVRLVLVGVRFAGFLRQFLLIPSRINKFMDLRTKCLTPCTNQFCRNLNNTWRFVSF